ncbi:MAG: hypothetical protein R3B07_07210 [Polyangiaceae bacterium]
MKGARSYCAALLLVACAEAQPTPALLPVEPAWEYQPCTPRSAPTRPAAHPDNDVWTGWTWGHRDDELTWIPDGYARGGWTPDIPLIQRVESRLGHVIAAQAPEARCSETWIRKYVPLVDRDGERVLLIVLNDWPEEDPFPSGGSPHAVSELVRDCTYCVLLVAYHLPSGRYVASW